MQVYSCQRKRQQKRPKTEKEPVSRQDKDFKALFYRKLTETHLFFEVGRIIASELEPGDLVKKIIAAVGKAIAFEDASVYVVKKDLTGLDPLYHHQSCLTEHSSPASIYFDNGAPGQIAASGEPLFLDDTRLYESFLHHPDEEKQIRQLYRDPPQEREPDRRASWVSATASGLLLPGRGF